MTAQEIQRDLQAAIEAAAIEIFKDKPVNGPILYRALDQVAMRFPRNWRNGTYRGQQPEGEKP